jgi:hypothetical protein
MLNSDSVLHQAPGAASRQTGAETVVVLPGEGRFLVLNETGAQIWQCADGRRTLAEISAAVGERWGVEPSRAEADVLMLAGQLMERGALVLAPKEG